MSASETGQEAYGTPDGQDSQPGPVDRPEQDPQQAESVEEPEAVSAEQAAADNRLLDDARKVDLVLRLLVHAFVPDVEPCQVETPHAASVAYLKRQISYHTGILPKFQALKVPKGQRLVAGVTELRTMHDIAEDGRELCLEEFELKPPGQRHVWCYVSDDRSTGPTEVETPASIASPAEPRQQRSNPQTPNSGQRRKALPAPPVAARPPADEDFSPSPSKKAKTVGQGQKERKKNEPFSAEETELLIDMIERHTSTSWALIRNKCAGTCLESRSDMQLKDKWRNLVKLVQNGLKGRRVEVTEEQRERIRQCQAYFSHRRGGGPAQLEQAQQEDEDPIES